MKVRMTGARDLDRALSNLKKAAARSVARKALTSAAEPMRVAAEAAAPVRSGTLKAAVHVSGRTKKRSDAGAAAFGAALRAGQSVADARLAARAANRNAGLVTMFMGVESAVGQGVLQEFGTARHAPQPFMRPAWDAHKQGALRIITDELRAEIDKAVARAARKAARDARKAGM